MMPYFNLIIVFSFGAFFGFVELLQRYKEIKYTFYKKTTNEDKSTYRLSLLYIFINGVVSLIAFLLIKYFKNQVFLETNTIEIDNILISGFGGLMILRSSFFSIKLKDQQIDVGLAIIFKTFLDVVERKMKNNAAALRVCNIFEIMKTVDFNIAKDELPTLCISFIDNFTEEDSKSLTNKIVEISSSDSSNVNKAMQLGREIAYYCDEEILRRSIKKLPHILIENTTTQVDEYEKRKSNLK